MWIKNVRLEKNYIEEDGIIYKTETKIVNIEVENGKIIKIQSEDVPEGAKSIDAMNYFAIPTLRDCHVHLDKGHYGGPWQAVIPMNGVEARIKEEEGFLEEFVKYIPERAQALIDLITGFGVTFMRVQVNVDPVIGVRNLLEVKKVLEKNSHKLDYEIIAFPQHGFLKTYDTGYIEEALKIGVDYLGGLDPAKIDKDIEKSLTTTFELAKKYDVKIDMHLHSTGTLGIYEIERVLEYIDKYDMKGRVHLSHAMSLADVGGEEAESLAKKMADKGVEVNTTQPLSMQALSPMYFINRGVQVNISNDCINDHWQSTFSGDILERTNISCQIHGFKDEYGLSRALAAATGGITPLNDKGERVWPKVGDSADMLFARAESSAHFVARLMSNRVTMFKGNIVSGEFK